MVEKNGGAAAATATGRRPPPLAHALATLARQPPTPPPGHMTGHPARAQNITVVSTLFPFPNFHFSVFFFSADSWQLLISFSFNSSPSSSFLYSLLSCAVGSPGIMQSPAVVYVFRSFRPRRLMRCAHPPTNSASTPRPPIGRTRAIVRGLRTRRIHQPFQPPAHGQIDRSIDRSANASHQR